MTSSYQTQGHTLTQKQGPWCSSSMSKFLLVTLFTLALYTVVVNGYLGPRYGKRLPMPERGEEVSRIVGRSSGPRTIQSRSQARFYAGSRYGGKRSYWPSLVSSDLESQDSANPSPYDCVYVPYVGVRCAVFRSDSSQNGNGFLEGPDHDPAEEIPFEETNGPSASLTRTSIIDTVPSGTGTGSGSEN